MMADGASPDDAAASLLASGCGPIAAIKALRNAAAIGLAEAKEIVHRNLRPEEQKAAEGLWDTAIAALEADESCPECGRELEVVWGVSIGDPGSYEPAFGGPVAFDTARCNSCNISFKRADVTSDTICFTASHHFQVVPHLQVQPERWRNVEVASEAQRCIRCDSPSLVDNVRNPRQRHAKIDGHPIHAET